MGIQRADESLVESDTGAGSVPVVAFAADNRYALPLAAAVSSLIANLSGERGLSIFIVDGGISKKKKDRIMRLEQRERIRIQWLKPSQSHRDLLKSLPSGYVGKSCYYKMLIPDLIGPEHPKVICLDTDVIIEGDITELWDTELGNQYVLAVQDLLTPLVSSPFGLRNWRELERSPDDALFNTGVLVLNAAKWRQDSVSQMLVEYLRGHRQHIRLCDQDAMNAVFRHEWGRLDASWNALPYMRAAGLQSLMTRTSHEDLLMRANLLHYCGAVKPWNVRCTHPRKDRFFHYLDMTEWSGWRPAYWSVDTGCLLHYLRRLMMVLHRILGTKE